MRLPRVLADTLAAWVVVGAAATAQAERVAPLSPAIEPPPAPELKIRFHDAVGRGLQQGGQVGVDVVAGADVRTRLMGADDLLTCTQGACLTRAVAELRADRLVVTEVVIRGKSYSFTLRLLDQGGQEVWHTSESCDICSVREADELLAQAAARVAPWVSRPGPTDKAKQAAAKPVPPPKPVVPEPGKPAVAAPSKPVAPAAPKPETKIETKIESGTGMTELRPLPTDKGPEGATTYRPYYRYAWIGALAVAGGFAISSIPFLYYSSKGNGATCGSADPKSCQTLYDYKTNLGAGLGLLLGGGVLVGGGAFALFYYLDHREHKKAVRASLAPLVGGAMAGLEGTF